MRLDTEIKINFYALDEILTESTIPHDGYTCLMMNDYTVSCLTSKHFYDDRHQSYHGYPIIQNEHCAVGEVILLVNYERMVGGNND